MKEWEKLESEEDFYAVLDRSETKPQIIFKDSVSCGISAHAKDRLRQGHEQIEGKADFHYLNLLAFRSLSRLVAEELGVTHQSPQILVIRDRSAVYTASHFAIEAADIARHL